MKIRTTLLLALATMMACSSQTAQRPAIDEAKTKEILDHHLTVFTRNDLDDTMEDYTEESFLITPDGTFKGLAEIRKNFENAFKVLPKDSMTFTVKQTVIVQDLAYIIWEARTPKLDFSFGTDTFIIRDGKIVEQTYGGVVKPL